MKMELIEKDKNPTFSYFLGFIHFPTFQDLSISSIFQLSKIQGSQFHLLSTILNFPN
jgi:hypothetical protein